MVQIGVNEYIQLFLAMHFLLHKAFVRFYYFIIVSKNNKIYPYFIDFHLILHQHKEMGKKCIPGLFCIENMTLFLLFILCIVIIYLYYKNIPKNGGRSNKPEVIRASNEFGPINTIGSTTTNGVSDGSILTNGGSAIVLLSTPPLANIGMDPQRIDYQPPSSYMDNITDLRNGVWKGSWAGPFAPSETEATMRQQNKIRNSAIPTRGYAPEYSPIGILSRVSGSGDMILPLMGRQNVTGRSKYQYYTMMTSGSANPPLPVSVNGKSCASEYGCDEISNGDIVYVDGINDTFRATIYENDFFAYVPY